MLDAPATERTLESSVVAIRSRRDVIDAEGPDAADYLHGQLSQDVIGLAIGESKFTLLLAPQGKIDAWLRLTRLGEQRYWLDVAPGFGSLTLERLQRFKLRVDAEFTLHEYDMVAVRGTPEAAAQASADVEAPTDGAKLGVLWPGESGFDLLGPDVVVPPGIDEGSPETLEALRIQLGRPAMGSELDEKTIPAAAGVVDGSVDFTKGCYVGQELVARIDSRGNNTPTHLRGILLTGDDTAPTIAAGADIVQDGNVVGRVTSVATGSSFGSIALGYVKRAVEMPSTATILDATGEAHPAELVELPLRPRP